MNPCTIKAPWTCPHVHQQQIVTETPKSKTVETVCEDCGMILSWSVDLIVNPWRPQGE